MEYGELFGKLCAPHKLQPSKDEDASTSISTGMKETFKNLLDRACLVVESAL